MFEIPDPVKLAVSKAFAQFDFIGKSYALDLWGSKERKENLMHDCGVMRAHGDLTYSQLELLDATKAVVFRYQITFRDAPSGEQVTDSAKGIELPYIRRGQVQAHRFLVSDYPNLEKYRHLLKLSWSNAERLTERLGGTFESEHANAITQGRQSGQFQVGAHDRHRLVVTQTGNRDYAFADAPALGLTVFIHKKFVAPGVLLEIGKPLTAVLVQTPKGFQARDVRAA